MQKPYLAKYCAPTKFDVAAFGTLWRVLGDDDTSIDYYIQINNKEGDPVWEKMGIFLNKIFNRMYADDRFIEDCLNLYVKQQIEISEYLKSNPVEN